MKLIFLGSPGAGKGTQAELLSKILSIPKLSTGDILRLEMKNETELGLELKSIINRGDLVSDEVMIKLVTTRLSSTLCNSGYILDGFPRTVAQAIALDNFFKSCDAKDVVIVYFDIPENEVVRRISGRLTCKNCGAGFHKEFLKPEVDGVCDKCGSTDLILRDDDKPEAVKHRLGVYNQQTKPLLDYYKKDNRLNIVNALLPINSITALVLELLGAKNGGCELNVLDSL